MAYLLGDGGVALRELTIRFSAIDAKSSGDPTPAEIEPVYSLSEQLFVEPQPLLTKRSLDDDRIITSTRQEIAVARSHIEVWKLIAASSCDYALILEDDVYFNSDARRLINRAWSDLPTALVHTALSTCFTCLTGKRGSRQKNCSSRMLYSGPYVGFGKCPDTFFPVLARKGCWI